MATIRGVIFDVDGTLVDSNDAHAQAWADALNEHGYPIPWQTIRPLIGMGGDNFLPEAAGLEKDSEIGEQIAERRGEIFKSKYLPTVVAFPETRALLQHIHDAGLRVAVGSSANKDELEPLLEIAQVTDLVEEVTSADDAEKSKPDPDIVIATLEQLGLQPDEVIMIGDTEYDIEAATKAGVRVIALRCGGQADTKLAGAVAIYADPADLLAHYEESPLAVEPDTQA